MHFLFSLGQMKLGAIQCFVSGMKPGFLEGHLAVQNTLKSKFWVHIVHRESNEQVCFKGSGSSCGVAEVWGRYIWATWFMLEPMRVS